jgi:ABC-type multidrug transport system fused ATPase/permease subunit
MVPRFVTDALDRVGALKPREIEAVAAAVAEDARVREWWLEHLPREVSAWEIRAGEEPYFPLPALETLMRVAAEARKILRSAEPHEIRRAFEDERRPTFFVFLEAFFGKSLVEIRNQLVVENELVLGVQPSIGQTDSSPRSDYTNGMESLSEPEAVGPQAFSRSSPESRSALSVENLTLYVASSSRFLLENLNFKLEAGSCLGVIGPTGAGKSSLLRVLAGIYRHSRGSVIINEERIEQWSDVQLRERVGYLSDEIYLPGPTVRQAIARFDRPDSDQVIAAAKAANVHDIIQRLPDGYDTEIRRGLLIPRGWRQLIGLARALYRGPSLVVLDEPNSNLDADGDKALQSALLGVRERGGIVVLSGHRPSALAAANLTLVLAGGSAYAFGPKLEVLAKVLRGPQADDANERVGKLRQALSD